MLEGLTKDTQEAHSALRRYSDRTGHGRGFRVTSGLRSCAQQNAVYAKGRTAPGPVATNVRNCRSWHVHGRAFDIDFPGFSWSSVTPLGLFWEKLGGSWGGRFNDPGHFEWHPGVNIWELCPNEDVCQFSRMREVAPRSFGALPSFILTAAVLSAGAYYLSESQK